MTIEHPSGGSEMVFLVATGTTFAHNTGTLFFSHGSGIFGAPSSMDVPVNLDVYDLTVDIWNPDILGLASGDTVTVHGTLTHREGDISGDWIIEGDVLVESGADGGSATLSFAGTRDQTFTDQGGDEPNGDITIDKSSGIVTLLSDADWNAGSQDLIITSGVLDMGTLSSITTNNVTVEAGAMWRNRGTGDVTLAGTVTNNGGRIGFHSSNTCGHTDSISIQSSSGGIQRSWNGTGEFILHDVTVQDMGGSAAITAYSSNSVSGNGGNWTFDSNCPALPATVTVPSGKVRINSGKVRIK